MYLALLLLLPMLIGLGSFVFFSRRITWKEFVLLEGTVVLVMGMGYLVALDQSTADTEIWSGRIAQKERVKVSCRHPYSCNPHSCNCDSKGNCSTCYDTCYEHSFDYDWDARSTNGESVTINTVDRQGLVMPPRWGAIYVGEPTAFSHGFTNYIKAVPNSVLRRRGTTDKFKSRIPSYPKGVQDYYRCNRFLSVGVPVNHPDQWNWLLNEVNADLGAVKQVNVILVVVNTNDSDYQYALEESWLGGKKNDLIVLIGSTQYPKIDWVRIISWSTSEDLKIILRDRLQAIGSLDLRDSIIAAIRQEVRARFVRHPMKEFKYLMTGYQPGTTGTLVLLGLGVMLSVGLSVWFYRQDIFNEEWRNKWERKSW